MWWASACSSWKWTVIWNVRVMYVRTCIGMCVYTYTCVCGYACTFFVVQVFPPFLSSSRDAHLLQLAAEYNCSLASSTSSLTPILAHIYYAVSNWKCGHVVERERGERESERVSEREREREKRKEKEEGEGGIRLAMFPIICSEEVVLCSSLD